MRFCLLRYPSKEMEFTKSVLGMETGKRGPPKSQFKGKVGVIDKTMHPKRNLSSLLMCCPLNAHLKRLTQIKLTDQLVQSLVWL